MAVSSARPESVYRASHDAPPTAAGSTQLTQPPARRRGPRRRRLPYLTVGGLLVIVCVLTFAYTATRLGDRISVLAVARPVTAGHPIAAADLKEVTAADDGQLGLIPAAQAGQVVGRTAAVPLVPGELLVPGLLGGASFPAAGKVTASLALKPGQYPQGLAAGAPVAVFIALPVTNSATSSSGSSSGPSVGPVPLSAVALGVDLAGDGQGATVVTLLLDSADAPRLAAAPAGSVMVMQTAPTANESGG